VELVIGILKRLGATEGQKKYKAKYDVNHDGVIDTADLLQVVNTPTCGRADHDDHDEDHHGDRRGGHHDD